MIAAAGELATNWGITGWQQGESMQAAIACFKSWLESYGEGNQEERAMLGQVRHFLELHSEGRFADVARSIVDDIHAPKVLNKAGFRKHSGSGDEAITEFFVFPEVFKTEVCKGHDYKRVARLLISKGYMRQEGKHLQPKVRLPGLGLKRVFHILPGLLGADND